MIRATIRQLPRIILVLICISAALVIYGSSNMQLLLRQWTLLGFMALGLFTELLTGDLDLSFAAHVSAGTIIAAVAFNRAGSLAALIAVFIFSLFLSLIKGVLVNALHVPALIITLAIQMIITGLMNVFLQNEYIYITGTLFSLDKRLFWFAAPAALVLAAFLFSFLLRRFTLGFYLRLVGEDRDGLEQIRGSCRVIFITSHMLAGIFFAIASLLLLMRVNGISAGFGSGFLYQGIMAVCLGGVSLIGGRGEVHGVLLGALAAVIIQQILTDLGAVSSMGSFMQGLIILAALYLSRKYNPVND